MKELVLLSLLCAAFAANVPSSPPKCMVGTWGAWGKCESQKLCKDKELIKSVAVSYPLEATKMDHGAARMNLSKERKQESFRKIQECREDPLCLEVSNKQDSGYIACEKGFAGEYPCDSVNQLSFLNFESLSGNDPLAIVGNDIWGWTDPENGDEYAIYCIYSGTSFVRMTDPQNPVVVGYLPTRTTGSSWRDAKVIGNFVYIISEATAHGMQIYDLTQLRDSNGFQEVHATVEYLEFGQCHNVVANPETNTIYGVGARYGTYPNICDGGLHAVDVSDPLNPRFAGCYGDDGYVHDAQCLIYSGPDTEHQGKEICFCYNEDSLTIVDATDKSNMNLISKESYIGYEYTHQGWLTEDQTTLLLDDELDEFYSSTDKHTRTYIWDVKDLETPTLMNIYYHAQESIDHNQYILGNYTYQSNYKAGLRILHIDQENYDLQEVAYFDVNEGESADFAGSWSNYPYFASGNIALGSIDYGLFVVKPDMTAINEKVKQKVFGSQKRSRKVTRRGNTKCPKMEETRQCVPEC